MKMHLLTQVSSKAPSNDRGNLCSSVQIWPIVWKKDCVSLVNVGWCSFRQRQMNIILLLLRCVLCTKHKLVAKRNPFNVGFVWILSILPAVLSQQLTEMRSKENELLQIRYTKWLHLPSLDRRVCLCVGKNVEFEQTNIDMRKGRKSKNSCLLLFAIANIDPKLSKRYTFSGNDLQTRWMCVSSNCCSSIFWLGWWNYNTINVHQKWIW